MFKNSQLDARLIVVRILAVTILSYSVQKIASQLIGPLNLINRSIIWLIGSTQKRNCKL